MDYNKISQVLYESGYIDDRRIMCHSHNTVTEISNRILFLKVTTTKQLSLPNFMILSINKDKLIISKATSNGDFYFYHDEIDLNKMKYITTDRSLNTVHYFQIHQGYGNVSSFFINSIQHQYESQKLVDAIIRYNKGETEDDTNLN